MPKGGRKRAAAAGGGAARKKGAPAARSSAHLLVHTPSAADCGGAPPIEPEEPPSMLGALVWPLSKEAFLADQPETEGDPIYHIYLAHDAVYSIA